MNFRSFAWRLVVRERRKISPISSSQVRKGIRISGNDVGLVNGERWTRQQFLDHYIQPPPSGTPTPVTEEASPVPVDMSWYMSEGPGRYYHPGMFPIVNRLISHHDLAPGTYNLWDLVPDKGKDVAVKAFMNNYITDPRSPDYKTRAFVFGNESARISGNVVVDPSGSKTFKDIEIRPFDTNFNFNEKTDSRILEFVRRSAQQHYDPQNLGVSYQIPFRGNGRKYEPFTGDQLNNALRHPESGPDGLLPSLVPASPPSNEQRGADQSTGDAGRVTNPDSSVSSPQAEPLPGIYSNRPMPDWPFPPPIFDRR